MILNQVSDRSLCGPRNLLFCNGLHQARLRSSTALGAVVLLLQAGAMNCFLTRMRRLKPFKSLLPPVLREGKATTAVITGCVPPGASSSCSKGLQWSATVHTESGCALISSKELIFSHNIVPVRRLSGWLNAVVHILIK